MLFIIFFLKILIIFFKFIFDINLLISVLINKLMIIFNWYKYSMIINMIVIIIVFIILFYFLLFYWIKVFIKYILVRYIFNVNVKKDLMIIYI